MWWKCLTPVPSQHLDFWNAPTQRNLQILCRPRQTCDIFTAQHLELSTNQECNLAEKKQWLKRVTGSAVISLSWENARDFSSFVRSIQEVISFPINYLPCRKKRKKKKNIISPAWATVSAFFPELSKQAVWGIELYSDVRALSFLRQRTMATS